MYRCGRYGNCGGCFGRFGRVVRANRHVRVRNRIGGLVSRVLRSGESCADHTRFRVGDADPTVRALCATRWHAAVAHGEVELVRRNYHAVRGVRDVRTSLRYNALHSNDEGGVELVLGDDVRSSTNRADRDGRLHGWGVRHRPLGDSARDTPVEIQMSDADLSFREVGTFIVLTFLIKNANVYL